MPPPEPIDPALCRVASAMESLGRNCEFGMVQRRCKLEPISLLRWSGGATADYLRALANGFEGLMESASGIPGPRNAPPEAQNWWLRCSRTNILFHTAERTSQFSVEEATGRVRRRFVWLAGKQMEAIRSGEKLFLHSTPDFVDDTDALAFAAVFREIGGCGPLLLVGEGEEGPLSCLAPDTWLARLPKLSPIQQANLLDLEAWLGLLAQLSRHPPLAEYLARAP